MKKEKTQIENPDEHIVTPLDLYEIARSAHNYIKDFGFSFGKIQMRKDLLNIKELTKEEQKRVREALNRIHKLLYKMEGIFVSADNRTCKK